MTSKNSFLVNMRENLKRRKGIAVLYSVFFLLAYPVGLALYITSAKGYLNGDYGERFQESITESFSIYLGMNFMSAMAITILAVICAVQGFSYLFKKQKLDLYLSVPVSKERRFAVIYLNGILLYAVPYLFSMLISLGIGAGNGVYVGQVIKTLIFSYLSYLIYYLAIYNIAVIAVMMTGNTLVSLCAAGVFLFYEGAVRVIMTGMSSIYFRTYSSYNDAGWYNGFFSPALLFCSEVSGGVIDQNIPYLLEKFGFVLIKTAVIAAAAGIAGYFLYTVRLAESCNKAIAFKKTRPFIKVALMTPFALVAGILFYMITNHTGMTILGFILGVLLSHGILEVIFEFDLKAMFKSLPSMAVSTVVVFCIFAVFKFDLTGYDKWVPRPEQIESAAVSSYELAFNSAYDLENGGFETGSSYMLDHMEITDTETFCALMRSVVESKENVLKEKAGEEESRERWIRFTVKYRMKNGKEKYRSVDIPYEVHKEDLNRLVGSAEYRKGTFQILDEEFIKNASLEGIRMSNGIAVKEVEEADIDKVLQAYKEDLVNYDMETAAETYPIGVIDFKFVIEFDPVNDQYGNMEQNVYCAMPVYETFEKTAAYAEEKGLLEDWKTLSESIDRITVSRYNEEYEEWVEKDYSERKEIEAIFPALIPEETAVYKVYKEEVDHNYSVYVSYKMEETMEDNSYRYFMVKPDLLPDFAK